MAIACRPATPAPMTNAFAGASVPAAVVIIGRIRGSALAPTSTALYPASVACDESASIDCARVMRGTSSIASAVTRRAASRCESGPLGAGARRATRTRPRASRPASSTRALDRSDHLAPPSAARPSATSRPAASYAASGKPAAAPAPALDAHLVPLLHEPRHVLRHERDAALPRRRLPRNRDAHVSLAPPVRAPRAPRDRRGSSSGPYAPPGEPLTEQRRGATAIDPGKGRAPERRADMTEERETGEECAGDPRVPPPEPEIPGRADAARAARSRDPAARAGDARPPALATRGPIDPNAPGQ